MQDSITLQTPMQPFIKLVQNNMALLTRFWMSPELVSRTMADAQSSFRREPGAVNPLAQSNVFGQLMQGLLDNYAEFIAELRQSGMTLLAQGQAAAQEVEDVAETAAAESEARGRRSR